MTIRRFDAPTSFSPCDCKVTDTANGPRFTEDGDTLDAAQARVQADAYARAAKEGPEGVLDRALARADHARAELGKGGPPPGASAASNRVDESAFDPSKAGAPLGAFIRR